MSSAKPKIANYPFTTLEPNLGIVSYRDGKSFVMADIPGIIEGASAGKGLGLRFLRHIERNSLLLFMVPADSDDIRKEYEILLNELRTFNPEMLDKQRVLAITKCDMLDQELMDEIEPTLPESIPHVFISAISGLGISTLKDMLWEELNKESNKIEGKIESIAHRAKDMSHLKEELKDEGEDGQKVAQQAGLGVVEVAQAGLVALLPVGKDQQLVPVGGLPLEPGAVPLLVLLLPAHEQGLGGDLLEVALPGAEHVHRVVRGLVLRVLRGGGLVLVDDLRPPGGGRICTASCRHDRLVPSDCRTFVRGRSCQSGVRHGDTGFGNQYAGALRSGRET